MKLYIEIDLDVIGESQAMGQEIAGVLDNAGADIMASKTLQPGRSEKLFTTKGHTAGHWRIVGQ
jgi:hypothetical protein